MIKVIAIALALLIAAVLVFAASKPDTFRVQRTTTIKAAPEKVFGMVNDLHHWAAWSPYEKKDPAMRRTFAGAPSGKGATYEWDGNNNVGKGRMEIVESVSPVKVGIKLDFMRPIEGHNTAEFTFAPRGDSTDVTWAMYGPAPFVSKLIGLFINMDTMIGNDFHAGLANLKSASEQ